MTQALAKTTLLLTFTFGVTACQSSEPAAESPPVSDVAPTVDYGDGCVVELYQDEANADYEGEEFARWADGADPDTCFAAQGMGIDDNGRFTFVPEGY